VPGYFPAWNSARRNLDDFPVLPKNDRIAGPAMILDRVRHGDAQRPFGFLRDEVGLASGVVENGPTNITCIL
jgi:hypothetical protein